MQYTIGLDFGTHQTKCCIEERDRNYQKFWFVKFVNCYGTDEYRLPSLIKLKEDGRLEYGFFAAKPSDRVFRYFKQSTFNQYDTDWYGDIAPQYLSIWYLTYLIFYLKKNVGEFFNINMGIPTDSTQYSKKKQIAVGLLKSAYLLCEDTFNNDMNSFLDATCSDLLKVTQLLDGTDADCKDYGIKVFPEAWACLRPLLNSNRLIALNMLMDIGGGTTDFSLFSVKKSRTNPNKNELNIYYYASVNKGLNFISKSPFEMNNGNVSFYEMVNTDRLNQYHTEIKHYLNKFIDKLESQFKTAAQGEFKLEQLDEVIKNKQTIYVGGGSTFSQLRRVYRHFSDVRMINTNDWKMECIQSFSQMNSLCPILSTSYGLAISEDEGTINPSYNLCSLFDGIRDAARIKKEEATEKQHKSSNSFGKAYGGFSYGDDYDAWK